MKIFTQPVLIILLTIAAAFAGQTVTAQLVMNPNDTVYTYNSTAAVGTPTNPKQPASGKIGKWIRTVRMSWNTSEWKAYIFNGSDFRIHFPHSYNPTANDGKKYPILVFYHGDGEQAGIDDNEDQLDHGAQPFQTAIDNGTFDGYAIFMQCQFGWTSAQFANYQVLIDSLVANYKGDPYRVVQNGLSGGGQGIWDHLVAAPTYFAGAIPMSATLAQDAQSSVINVVKYTPIWNLDGGLDNDPEPYTAYVVADSMAKYGANYTLKEYSTLGHDTWDSTWLEPNFWPFVNNAYESNPWPLFGRTKFCPGQTINVTLGVVPGLAGYQWALNGNTIANATKNTYVATAAGSYTARVMRGADGWSNWSPIPVQIVVQTATITPPIALVGAESSVLPDAAGDTTVTLSLPTGDSLYVWKFLSTNTVVGNSATLTVGASKTGDYVASLIPYLGCSSVPSPAFPVVKASGPNPPPPATSLVANSLGFTKIRLTWSAQPNPSNPPTGYEVYRGTKSGTYKFITLVAYDSLAYTDSSLSPNGKYYYAVRAVDTTGAAPLSNEATAMTTSDVTPPTAPDSLTIVYSTNTSVSLAWEASTDNVGVDHYAIYVNGVLANVTPTLTFIVNGLSQGQIYSFYVKAVDGSGNYSTQSNQVSTPALASGLQYKYYTTQTSWSVLPNFSTLTPVMTGAMPNVSIANATQTTNFGYIWTGYINIPVAGTYTFATSSDDGSALWFNTLTPTSTATATVNNDGAHGTVQVSSKALTLQPGVYPICIEYFQATGGSAMTVSWSCPQLFGNSTLVAIANKYFTANYTPAGLPPAKPTVITATAASYKQVNVSWTDNSNNETGFEVYRASSISGPWQIIKTTAANVATWSDSAGLTPATVYYYKVQAINQYGGSGFDSASLGGLSYNFYQGAFNPLINYDSIPTPIVFSGMLNNYSLAPAGAVTTSFGFLYAGRINIPVSGTWTFYTSSDDASELFVNSYSMAGMVVNNNFQQGATQRSGTITLAKGTYPFYVSYEQSGGGDALTVSWSNTAAGIKLAAIPDSAFYNKNWTATTLPLPPAPVTPYNVSSAGVTSSRASISWTDTSSSLTGYTIYRSMTDTSHFNLLLTLGKTATSFNDSSLFGHQTYYYRIVASGPGASSAPATIGITTLDNPPVIAAIPTTYVRYGTTGTVKISATDVDGDTLALSVANLPSFGTLTNTGNGAATLTFSPLQANAGNYSGIIVTAIDHHGGVTNDTFSVVVNNNYPPVFNTISNTTMNTGATLNLPITATDQNAGDILSYTFTGLPANTKIAAGANGTDTLKLAPNFGDGGVYTVVATVNDGSGAIVSDTFHITVTKVSPTQTIYVQMTDGDNAGAPWNEMTSATFNGLKDSNGNSTAIGLSFPGGWFTEFNGGPVTGNNSGVYPDNVEKDYLFWGSYPYAFTGPNTMTGQLSGLDTSKSYSLTFYSGSVFSLQTNNGTTTYSCEGQTGSQAVQDNTQNTVTFSGLKPVSNGTISFTLGLGANTTIGYLNALVISSSYNDGTAPLTPSSLTVGLPKTGSGVSLNWYDSAYNATGYYILRSSSPNGPFVQLPVTAGATATSYTDSTTGSYRTYYYEVQAYNSYGVSNVSNVASINTPDRVPSIVAIASVNISYAQQQTVNVVTNADTTNPVTLSATGLPAFATLTDNGNGTGTISIVPTPGAAGFFNVTVTSTDSYDSTRSTSFTIIVRDPSVTSTYIHFSDGIEVGSFPWNNFVYWPSAGTGMGSLVNDQNVVSNMSFTFTNGMAGQFAAGMRPMNGAGIYSDSVMRSGEFETSTKRDTIRISGLSQTQSYNLVMFSSSDYGGSGITTFTSQGKSVTQNPNYNINQTVRLNNLTPDASGNIYLGVAKASGAQYAYINDLIVESYADTTSILAPTGLIVTGMTTKAVNLRWQVRSHNETAVQLWRGTDSTGTYTLLASLAPGTSTYVDSTVASNRNYYYVVNVVNGATTSNFSNSAYANPYAYQIYLSYSVGYTAPAPWNNIGIQPTLGQTWYNFLDQNGNTTNTGQVQTGTWGGVFAGGMQTGNNSGIVPDAVMFASYGLFPGTTGSVQLNNLDLNMTYDVTFFGSANLDGDNNAMYFANGKQAMLNATMNETGEVTIFGVQPDAKGNISISCMPGDISSQYGLMNAVILQAHSLSSIGTPSLPDSVAGAVTNQTAVLGALAMISAPAINDSTNGGLISAYPNPFHNQFTLQVPSSSMNQGVLVAIFDISGHLMYQQEFDGLTEGNNYLLVSPTAITQNGVYTVRILYSDKKTVKFLKLLRLN